MRWMSSERTSLRPCRLINKLEKGHLVQAFRVVLGRRSQRGKYFSNNRNAGLREVSSCNACRLRSGLVLAVASILRHELLTQGDLRLDHVPSVILARRTVIRPSVGTRTEEKILGAPMRRVVVAISFANFVLVPPVHEFPHGRADGVIVHEPKKHLEGNVTYKSMARELFSV
jgi:hypothetical protein